MNEKTEYDNINIIGNNWEDDYNDSVKVFNQYDKESRERIASKFLADAAKKERILDLGCSFGAWCPSLQALGFSNIVGIDISKERLKIAAKRGYTEVLVANGANLPFQAESFGTIICIDVLVHVMQREDWKRIFKEAHRVLKQGGYFVFSIVNEKGNNINNFIRLPVKLLKMMIGKKEAEIDYCTFSTIAEISALMKDAGFAIEDIEGQRFSYPDKLIYFPSVLHFLDKLFGRTFLKDYARVLFFKTRKIS